MKQIELIEKIKSLPDGRFLFMPNIPPKVSDMVAKTDDLKALVAMTPNWVSVEERLPEKVSSYLVVYQIPIHKTYDRTMLFWSGTIWEFGCRCRKEEVVLKVFFWMDFPELPFQEK